ncbi:hypothetical protein Q8F55_007439 [Vanrija albida]|uniref:Major facilitator superfamily (MFS) profile domain-containing protein n=1 Tax=Vanrija albida TaxID=181172 RepID=A0ABR3PTU0_9TREE
MATTEKNHYANGIAPADEKEQWGTRAISHESGEEQAIKGEPTQLLGHDIDAGLDPAEVKRITRKIDFRLIPMLIAMYSISLIDRTNLAVARTANENQFDKDLGTGKPNGMEYNIVTLVFFVPYIVFELPSQFGLKKFGARLWLGSAVTLWGFVMLGMGFVKNWQSLAALRAILGFFESALFPGAAFLISCWYPRRELAVRNVIFYITSAVAGSFAKLLGFGFSQANGTAGLAGWQWMFIIYGIITVIIGAAALIWLVDIPTKAVFLTEEEREIVQLRLERDRADSIPDSLTWAKVGKYALDPLPWLFALSFMSVTTSAYALSFFLPRLLTNMGFNNVESMVLGTPAYFWAIVPGFVCGRIADRIPGTRGAAVLFNSACIIAGTAMYSRLPMGMKAARMAGIFIACGGGNANVPLIISWQAVSIRSQSKRAFCSALTIAFGGIGGILGSTLFFNKEAKIGYPTGVYTIIGLNSMAFVFAIILILWFRWKNSRADRGLMIIEGVEGFRLQW